MQKTILLLILFSMPFILVSQTNIKGVVLNTENGMAVGGVVVRALDSIGEILAYDISSEEGEYVLSFSHKSKQIDIACSALGYRGEQKRILNVSQILNFNLLQSDIELKEVTIKSKPITVSEDTLRYSVNTFKSAGDRTIGDLLKKLPGIEVTESGSIKYNGEPINKFYIEGLDLLENRYGVATNNVPVDAVQNVEVIENHQPIKSIKGMVSSAQAAINLKLKDDKMSRPIGGVRAGGGYAGEVNWLLESFAMQASRQWQTMLMYKTNNSGQDIAAELNEHSISLKELQTSDSERTRELITKPSFGTPPIEKERFLFNNTHAASVNNLWKTGADSQLRLNINYLNDTQSENTLRVSEYFLPDSSLRIIENNDLTNRQQALDGALAYTDNSVKHYLENTLKWKFTGDKYKANTTFNNHTINQKYDPQNTLIENQLNYLKRNNEKIFNIGSFVAFSDQSEKLEVIQNKASEMQTIHSTKLHSNTGSYYSWFWGKSSLRISGSIQATLNRIHTNLETVLFTDSLTKHLDVFTLKSELTPQYTFKTRKAEFKAELPTSYVFFAVEDRLRSDSRRENFVLANPRVSLNYTFNPYLSAQLSYRYSQNIGSETDFLDMYLMKGFRSYYKPLGIISLRKSNAASLSFFYKNPLSSFFANGSLAYIPSSSNRTFASRIAGYQIIGSEQALANYANMWSARLYVGKYFSAIKTNFSLTTDINRNKTSRFQQSVLYPFLSGVMSSTFRVNTKVSDRISAIYDINWLDINTVIQTKTVSFDSDFNQINQQLKVYVSASKKLELNGKIEHAYNETGKDTHVNLMFANFGAKYKFDKFDFELYVNNIFNKKEYAYAVSSGLDSYAFRHAIRPVSLATVVSFRF